jgi:hypothetical protein
MVSLLESRRDRATICPSEAARAVGEDNWRPLMDSARRAAQRLAGSGYAEITRRGNVVDLGTAKGPIRVRRMARRDGESTTDTAGTEAEGDVGRPGAS